MYVKRKKIAACIEKHTNFLQWGGAEAVPHLLADDYSTCNVLQGGGDVGRRTKWVSGVLHIFGPLQKKYFFNLGCTLYSGTRIYLGGIKSFTVARRNSSPEN